MRVLVIEDEADVAATVCDFLEARGHAADWAGDGLTGLHRAVTGAYDAIVLDLMLPGIDGLELCRRLRAEARRATPLLMLTARDTLADKLAGFEAGADDYLVKPFEPEELEARLQALLRRGRHGGRRLAVADLELDLDTREVRRGGRVLRVTPTGFAILEILARNSHRVVGREELEHALWGEEPPESDALRSHIHQLRAVVDRPFAVPLIRTVHGVGYRLSAPDAL
ncbi:response regulator transcription factor [Inmirania thermothiophila]|uniref:DNA-binding response OmpR family regulator n=1 Tax=Inmirania thermothiophila TaxID=1750597 RepID=A0A3N1Y7S8_9GAMM|nr:response regulator transcription factor [Inmirania thermothiophila]ROR34879.1 DNA-binding response OmpR family regulator [Inmirania thermothiophila]